MARDPGGGDVGDVRRLEHVEVVANIQYPVRGALEVALVSPSGELSERAIGLLPLYCFVAMRLASLASDVR